LVKMGKLNRVLAFIDRSLIMIAKILLAVMVIIVSVNVFMRYVLNSGIRWAEEISLVCIVWFTFIALAHGVKEKLHINMNLLPSKIARKLDIILDKLSNITILFVGYIMVHYGIKLVNVTSRSILPASNLPASVIYFPLVLSGILIISNCLIEIMSFSNSLGGHD